MRNPHLRHFLHASAIYLAMAAPAVAQYGASSAPASTVSAGRPAPQQGGMSLATSSMLFARYRGFLGSDADTRSVIQGLRYRELITLGGAEAGARSTTFIPPTPPLSWSNIDRALSVAQGALASLGIEQATAAQIKLALTGGTWVAADGRVVAVQGVLSLRSQGKGWDEIADMTASAGGPKAAHEAAPSGRVRVSIAAPEPSDSINSLTGAKK